MSTKLSTPTMKRAGADRRETEEKLQAEEEARRHPAPAAAAAPAPPPPRHPDPVVASTIGRLERHQRGQPDSAKTPFLPQMNLLLGLANRYYQRPQVLLPVNALNAIDLPGVEDNRLRGRLAELWLSHRNMAKAQERWSNERVTAELEARRAQMLSNPDTSKVVSFDAGKEKSKIREEFMLRRQAHEEAWLKEHLFEYFELLAALLPPILSRLQAIIEPLMERARAEGEFYGGIAREDLPPDFTTLGLVMLYHNIQDRLVRVTRRRADYEHAKRTNGILREVYFTFDQGLMELLGVQKLDLEADEATRERAIADAERKVAQAKADLERASEPGQRKKI